MSVCCITGQEFGDKVVPGEVAIQFLSADFLYNQEQGDISYESFLGIYRSLHPSMDDEAIRQELRHYREDLGFMLCNTCYKPHPLSDFEDPGRPRKNGKSVLRKTCSDCIDNVKEYRCRKCKEVKLGREFAKNKDGVRQSRCKECNGTP